MTFITTAERLSEIAPLDRAALDAIGRVSARYPWRITEYYASLMDQDDPDCPIRRQAIPDVRELDDSFGVTDPLCEEENSPATGVIQVYPDRVAVLTTSRCPVYCRFCLRKRLPRDESGDLTGARLDEAVRYVKTHPAIRDVLLTGGDPLMLSDGELDRILGAFRAIPHVDIIRIGTRALCTWPERITSSFAEMVKKYHPVWINTQFNHPREITPEASRAADLLLSAGMPLGNQSVLLRGVNDSRDVMLELIRKLVAARIRPYYLYQAQMLAGTGHFVTPVEKGVELIRGLRGWTTGFAVPQYVLDTPYGKIPLNPDYLKGRHGDYVELVSFAGRVWREYNPVTAPVRSPETEAGEGIKTCSRTRN